jgi:hypothetical protein
MQRWATRLASGAVCVRHARAASVSACRVALIAGLAAGLLAVPAAAGQRTRIIPPRSAAAAARGYLKAIKTEKGWRICPLVTAATKRAFIDSARADGLKVTRCAPAADHDFHRIGRVLGSFRVIRVEVHGRTAYATINDAPISDSGNDEVLLRKTRAGRWLVDDS